MTVKDAGSSLGLGRLSCAVLKIGRRNICGTQRDRIIIKGRPQRTLPGDTIDGGTGKRVNFPFRVSLAGHQDHVIRSQVL